MQELINENASQLDLDILKAQTDVEFDKVFAYISHVEEKVNLYRKAFLIVTVLVVIEGFLNMFCLMR